MRLLFLILARVAVGGLFLASFVGGAAFLHMRAAQSKRADARIVEPMPVASVSPKAADGFDVVDRFVGLLEPAQQSRVAFERAGLINSVRVEEGQYIERHAVIATLDTALLHAERERLLGQRQQVGANLELARLTEGRKRVLHRKDHVSRQVLDEARLHSVATKGQLAAVDAAITRVDVDLAKSEVRAPFSGTVGARFVDTGVVVTSGTAVVDLLESDKPQARIGVSPGAALKLNTGDIVTLVSAGQTLAGTVIAIRADVSNATRTISVLVALDVRPSARFGDTVEMHIKRHVEQRGYWLPISALSEGERGLWSVLTLKSHARTTFRVGREAVELLHVDGINVFVRGTLGDKQHVIASGRNRVIPGQIVSITVGDTPAGDRLPEVSLNEELEP